MKNAQKQKGGRRNALPPICKLSFRLPYSYSLNNVRQSFFLAGVSTFMVQPRLYVEKPERSSQ